jgi:hypothetical protein
MIDFGQETVMYHPKLNHSRYAKLANSRIPLIPYRYATCQIVLTSNQPARGVQSTDTVERGLLPSIPQALLRADRPAHRSFPYYTSCLTPSTQMDSFKRVFSRLPDGVSCILNQDSMANPVPESRNMGKLTDGLDQYLPRTQILLSRAAKPMPRLGRC